MQILQNSQVLMLNSNCAFLLCLASALLFTSDFQSIHKFEHALPMTNLQRHEHMW